MPFPGPWLGSRAAAGSGHSRPAEMWLLSHSEGQFSWWYCIADGCYRDTTWVFYSPSFDDSCACLDFFFLIAAHLSERSDTSVCRQPCSFPLETTHLICYCPVQTSSLVILTTKDSLTHTFIHWWHKHNLTVSPLLHQVLACRTFTAMRKRSAPATPSTHKFERN